MEKFPFSQFNQLDPFENKLIERLLSSAVC